jgi:cysteine desulfurase
MSAVREAGDEGPIYLDHNATTPIDPRVLDTMVQVWRDCGANPASQHAAGRRARRYVEGAREGIIALLGGNVQGIQSDRLIFTSGGTEANHLALLGLSEPGANARSVAISALEHPSIKGAAKQLEQSGLAVHFLPVLATGLVDVAAVADLLQDEERRPQLISVMPANNDTGILQPVAEISRLAAGVQTIVHTDAAQAVGKVPVHFRELGVAALTIAPHKFHGPVGIGGLLVCNDVQLRPQMLGGFQQGGLRPGTECAALAVGFHRALQVWREEHAARYERMCELRDEFSRLIHQELPNSVLIGADVSRTPHTACISFPPLDRQALVMALDLAGVACSTGSACASGSSEPSPALVAMGRPEGVVQSALRFSLGAFTTAAEVRSAAERIIKTVKQLQTGR